MIEIPLTNGGVARIDDADLHLVSLYRWRKYRNKRATYAQSGQSPALILMHRLILGAPKGVMVDHADRDGLNNTRENIRFCSNAENMMNIGKMSGSSKFKGVSWHTKVSKWRVTIRRDGCTTELGEFENEIAAAKQYDRAARIFFGKFARTNEMMGLLP